MSPAVRTVILWLHAVGGVAWIGAAAVFVIGAIASDDEVGLGTVRRIAPAINRIGLVAMLFIIVSGIVNVYLAGMMRNFVFSNTFVMILAIKIAILCAMYVLLMQAWRAEPMLASIDADLARRATGRLIKFNLGFIALGGAALLMGLWLLGS